MNRSPMDIHYIVNRSRKRKKTISLQIRHEADVVISVPYFTPVSEIRRFVREKQNWIDKTIRRQREEVLQNGSHEYLSGENFFYLGHAYPLEVFFEPFEKTGVVFRNNCFYLNTPENKQVKKHYFISWYREKAHDYIYRRVDYFGRMLKLHPECVSITSAESRWGSCSEDNRLAFSFRLIMTPPDVIDYVIVHELMHIPEKNHSSEFWRRVEDVMPDYKEHRRWLREHHRQFML